MFDCANVEMRELLPELAAGTLDAATRARVEQHVASCAECASELETLRLVRAAYANAPAVEVQRIVAALPKAPEPLHVRATPRPISRWTDWRVAAALTMITVGGLSLAIARQRNPHPSLPPSWGAVVPQQDTTQRTVTQRAPKDTTATRVDTNKRGVQPILSPAPSSKAQLAFARGVEDLDDASIKALLGALDELDRAPLAPSAEPDHTPVLPVSGTGQR